jgi:hypothetical protein
MVAFPGCQGSFWMGFHRIAMLCIALAAMAFPVRADQLSDYKAYQHVADSCGKTTNWSYSKAQYAEGKAAANRDIARLKAKGSSYAGRIAEIEQAKKKLKECEKEEAAKFPFPPFTDCKKFLGDTKSFRFWAAKARQDGSATESDIERSQNRFKPLADHCVREVLKNCIDPLDTKAVLEAIDMIETASQFTDVYTYAKQTGLERFLTRTNPFFLTLKFCADTDFACTGDPDMCKSRRASLRAALQAFVER